MRVRIRCWNDLAELGDFDLVVNATSAWVARETLTLPAYNVGAFSLSAAEFGQLVIVRLVLAEPERQAKILSYRGQGSLRAWVRVTAARLVIDLSRRRAEPAGSDALLDQLSGGEDLELEHLRDRFGPEL